MSNHAFKQTRDYNGEIKKDIQVDLDTFTHISAYSGILRHVQILLSIFYSQLAIETESKILTAVSKGQRNNKLLLPIAFLLRSSALVFCLQICNPPRSILDLPFTPTFSQPFLWLLNTFCLVVLDDFETSLRSQYESIVVVVVVVVVAYSHSQQIYICFVCFGSTNNKFFQFLPIFSVCSYVRERTYTMCRDQCV